MNEVFYISAVVTAAATLMAITRRSAVHALLYLIVSLLAIAVIFLTLGAAFAAMNTMYAAVSSRIAEIGTLRAIGYRRREILASFQWEAILLTFLGGLAGAALSLAFNGTRSGTVNMNTWSDVSYAFAVTPALLAQGVGFSVLMGIVGGFLPAWKASRMPITEAMRS